MDIGSTIKEIRAKHGLSQEQFAEQFHVTRQTVSNWENQKNYPDLSTLVEISKTFDVSLDEFIKEDNKYIADTDVTRKKVKRSRLIICILLLIVIAILAGSCLVFIYAWSDTEDGKRITSDTDVRMMVNLKNQTPSSAITETYDAKDYDGFTTSKKGRIRTRVIGKIEGDIPCVFMDSKMNSMIGFSFQDGYYKNITPRIKNIQLYTAPGLPPEIKERTDRKIHYYDSNGETVIYAVDFLRKDEVDDSNYEEGKEYVAYCVFVLKYDYQGESYASVTAVAVAGSLEN